MKTRLLFTYMASCLMFSAPAWSQDQPVRPLPGAEYRNNAKLMTYTVVKPDEIVEGSPVWVWRQHIFSLREMDFDALAKMMSPWGFEAVKKSTAENVQRSVGGYLLDEPLEIGDSKEEGDWCYVYIQAKWKYPNSKKTNIRADYKYFFRRDGKWIVVSALEWERMRLLKPIIIR